MVNFYKCSDCDKIYMEMGPAGDVCKGEGLTLLSANTSDGAVEKHVPVVSVEGDAIVVRIGEAPHPMTPEHYIQWVYVKTSYGGIYVTLEPTDPPEVKLKAVAGEVEEVYIYCNLHGLWKAKEPVLPLDFDYNTVACSPEFTAGCVINK